MFTEMDTVSRDEILDEAVCIAPDTGKLWNWLSIFILVWQPI